MKAVFSVLIIWSSLVFGQENTDFFVKTFDEHISSIEEVTNISELPVELEVKINSLSGKFPVDGLSTSIKKDYLIAVFSIASIYCDQAITKEITSVEEAAFYEADDRWLLAGFRPHIRFDYWRKGRIKKLHQSFALTFWGRELEGDEAEKMYQDFLEIWKENKGEYTYEKSKWIYWPVNFGPGVYSFYERTIYRKEKRDIILENKEVLKTVCTLFLSDLEFFEK